MYAKVFSQILDSSLAEDYETRHVFIDLLILADAEGVVDMTLEAIARRTNAPPEVISRAIAKLMQPDPRSRTADEIGKRLALLDDHRDWGWQIVNYAKFKSIHDKDMQRAYNTAYQRRRRARLAKAPESPMPVNPVKDGQGQSIHTDTEAEAYTEGERKGKALAAPESPGPEPPTKDQRAITLLVNQWGKTSATPKIEGQYPKVIYQKVVGLLELYPADRISEAIRRSVKAGSKPWVVEEWLAKGKAEEPRSAPVLVCGKCKKKLSQGEQGYCAPCRQVQAKADLERDLADWARKHPGQPAPKTISEALSGKPAAQQAEARKEKP